MGDENHSNGKGRGDTRSVMWNQVLLGSGRVKEQWWPCHVLPSSAHDVSLPPSILCSAALASASPHL